MNTAFLLIALGFGYKIYIEARQNNRKSMKRLGRIVGIFIMVVALLGTLCSTFSRVKYGRGGGYHCSLHEGAAGKNSWLGKVCPFSGKPISNHAANAEK